MNKKFIVFAGVIFIIFFGVMQVAVISTLGVNANINLDRTIAIFSGFFSLLGGVIGATGAYFIAKEQIKKQDSMKKVDLILVKLEEIISCFQTISENMASVNVTFRKHQNVFINDQGYTLKIHVFYASEYEEIYKEISKINELRVYLKFNNLEDGLDMIFNKMVSLQSVEEIGSMREHKKITEEISNNLIEVVEFKKKIEKEVENILFN